MEQESNNTSFNNTIERIGYRLTIAAHIAFISIGIIGTVILLTVLLIR